MSSHMLFVYGSLKRGFRHHDLLRGARFLEPSSTERGYRLVIVGDYPALVRWDGGVVHGEVYEVSSSLLARLDAFEDCPRLYQRVVVRLASGKGALTYAMDASAVSGCPVVPGGIWEGHAGPSR